MNPTQLDIIYEDNHLLVISKPAGLAVQPDSSGDECVLDMAKSYIKHKYNKPGDVYLGLPHRIDRPVSGIVILARTSKAQTRISKLFRERQVKKVYVACVQGSPNPTSGIWKNNLEKNANSNFVRVVSSKKGKVSLSRFKLIKAIGPKSILLMSPISGRSHQLRVQASHAGLPIIGDVKYKGPSHSNERSILLHHCAISFTHPTLKKEMWLYSFPPDKAEWKGILSNPKSMQQQVESFAKSF